MQFSTLVRSGRESARRRGHDMPPVKATGTTGRMSAISECRRCGAYLIVREHPAANEIDIGGSAVAVNCR